MTFRMSLLSLLCVGAVSTQLTAADAMIREVVGDSAPYFLGLVADDAVYAGKSVLPAINQGVRAWAEQGRDDVYNLGAWTLRQLKNASIPVLRSSYHSAKIALGLLLLKDGVLPNELLGIDSYRDGSAAGDTPVWKKAVKHVPGRVAGLGLVYHGVAGLFRQLGFDSFGEFYSFMEGRKADQDAPTFIQKPKPSSAKQR